MFDILLFAALIAIVILAANLVGRVESRFFAHN